MSGERFWSWFCKNLTAIEHNYNDAAVVDELDKEVSLAWPELSWEIGPDASGGWYFALSPNLDIAKRDMARWAIQTAPRVPGWKFYPARQRKEWSGRFKISTSKGAMEINAGTWEFVLLRYADGETEVFLIGPEALLLSEDERWHAAAVVVEGLLGEAYVLEKKLTFFLSGAPEERFFGRQKPIQYLPKAMGL